MLTRCLSLFPWITKSAIAWEVGVQVEPTTQTSNIWVIRVFSLPCLACWSHSPRSWAWTEGSCRLTMLDWGSRSESRLSSVDTNLWPDRTHCGSKQSSPRKHGYFYLTQATDTETTIPVLFRGGYFFFFFCRLCIKKWASDAKGMASSLFLANDQPWAPEAKRKDFTKLLPLVAWGHILPYSKALLVTRVSVTLKILHNNTCQHLKDQHGSARAVLSKAWVQTMGQKDAHQWWSVGPSCAYAHVWRKLQIPQSTS